MLIILASVAVVAALIVGIAQSGGGHDSSGVAPTPEAVRKALEGSPAPLAAVHDVANQMLPIGDLDARIKALRGYPIVINVWGSWCNPCREEFPVLQQASAQLGKRVAFLGIAMQDSKENAGDFLSDHPVSYPSYMDFDAKVATGYGVNGAPATIFYDVKGKRAYFHQGKYDSVAELQRDIERYTGA